jgi:hypothetical protein
MIKKTTIAALTLVSAMNIAATAPPKCTSRSACDGSVFLGPDYVPGTAVTLFGGVVPDDGFMVGVYSGAFGNCTVSDDGPATSINGFKLQLTGQTSDSNGTQPTPYALPLVTPPGYKPIGPVSVQCTSNEVSVEARGW